jgi:hypothetical protein
VATVREYFEKAFPMTLSADAELMLTRPGSSDVSIPKRVHVDPSSHGIFASILLPPLPPSELVKAVEALARSPEVAAKVSWSTTKLMLPARPEHGMIVGLDGKGPNLLLHVGSNDGSAVTTDKCTFTRVLYLYLQEKLDPAVRETLLSIARNANVSIGLRDPTYAATMDAADKPVAFISHDSRDKDEIARPLAMELLKKDCSVWYDEFSLKVGDNLRRSIERGLSSTRHCILVLTPHFLSKEGGWLGAELDIVFTREVNEGRELILPVWHKVTKEQVMAYSPTLANRLAVDWSKGIDHVCTALLRKIKE